MIKRPPYNPTSYGRAARFIRSLKSKNVFLAVMLLSAGAIFLPTWLTGQAQKVCQAWLAPGGRLALLAARKISPRAAAVEPDESAGLTDQQLQQTLTGLVLQLQQLQHENESLLKIRKAVGPGPSLVPAHVIGFDSMGLPSVEIDQGTEAGLKENQPVLATVPLHLLRALKERGLDPQLGLAAATFVGTISDGRPGPYTARVKLLTATRRTDRLFGTVVRYEDGQIHTLTPDGIYLEGTAKGDKLKGDSDNATFLTTALPVPTKHDVRPGDFVIPRDPDKLNLPVPLVLGIVEKVEPRTDSAIFVNLIIRPLFEKTSLNRVYVLCAHAESGRE